MSRDTPVLKCESIQGPIDQVRFGPDVVIECATLTVGAGVSIGATDSRDAFRFPGGVRITGGDVVLADGVAIGREARISGGDIRLGSNFRVGNAVTIEVGANISLAPAGTIHDFGEIAGHSIRIGRRLWMLPYAKIGGGGSGEIASTLSIGHWAHLGMRTIINTSRAVTLGREVGLGTGTALYTHGAYASALDGKPVSFGPIEVGDRSWIPGAVVNPGVRIGSDVVVGVGSVVTRDIPGGALAAGAPCRVLREKAYPRRLQETEVDEFFRDFFQTFTEILQLDGSPEFRDDDGDCEVRIGAEKIRYSGRGLSDAPCSILVSHGRVTDGNPGSASTIVDTLARTIAGPSTAMTERLLNQLRRYGIRFDYDAHSGHYVRWDDGTGAFW